ncbi:MAG: hypothetical protein ABF876_00080 [Acetobacter aceti]|uniref:Lipoprotein n=2 Tax=Acetobacter aceti TaxID=435 RepID=A0A1U9KCE4_ACEAC|nr:hypothetical protein [Acetobacter aceti]AQS83450.1 hypothetical protein A0U92_00275 [Acetobacter aceti]
MTDRSFLSRWLRRQAAPVMLALPLLLGGCGFHALYEDTKQHPGVSEKMKRVYIASIPERFGQMTRLALQQEFAGAGPEDPDGYTLQVNPGMDIESIDVHEDNTSGRMRVVGRAHWSLYTVEQTPRLLAQGDTTTMDGLNNTFEQYFAQSLNIETLQARVAKTLAEGVTQQVATWFETQTKAAVSNKPAAVFYPNTDLMPRSDTEQPVDRAGPDGVPAMATGRLDPNDDDPTR